ncbi:hypothetical protein ACI784_22065 [Geodermatophilus sp. SYSU D01186]
MSASRSLGRLGLGGMTAFAVTATTTLSACAENPQQPETAGDAPDIRGPEDLEDPYDGPYTEDFHTDVEAYVHQEVTLEASVERVVSSIAFTITGPDGEDVPPLLVVLDDPLPDLQAGQDVVVAATPQDDFAVSAVEDRLDAHVPEEPYEEWEGEPYLSASKVESLSL